jgi:hypothetical protein
MPSALTFTLQLPTMPFWDVALIVTEPTLLAVTRPLPSASLVTVATLSLLLDQVTSLLGALVGWGLAVRVSVWPTTSDSELGIMVTLVMVLPPPPPPPSPLHDTDAKTAKAAKPIRASARVAERAVERAADKTLT